MHCKPDFTPSVFKLKNNVLLKVHLKTSSQIQINRKILLERPFHCGPPSAMYDPILLNECNAK